MEREQDSNFKLGDVDGKEKEEEQEAKTKSKRNNKKGKREKREKREIDPAFFDDIEVKCGYGRGCVE